MDNLSPPINDFQMTDQSQNPFNRNDVLAPPKPLASVLKRESSLEDIPSGHFKRSNQESGGDVNMESALEDATANFEVAMSCDSPLVTQHQQPLPENEMEKQESFHFKLDDMDDSSDMEDSDEEFDQMPESDLKLKLGFKQQSSLGQNQQGSPALSGVTYESFRQLDYLWLFNPWLNFKEKIQSDQIDESVLTADDYNEMRTLNRMMLTHVCNDCQTFDLQDACSTFNEHMEQVSKNVDLSHLESELRENTWCDEMLDEQIKEMLKSETSGSHLPVDLVTHMEYFYNTLDCDVIEQISNPFKSVKDFPALICKVPNPNPEILGEKAEITLFECHRNLIFPYTLKTNSRSSWVKALRSQSTHLGTSNQDKTLNSGSGSDGGALPTESQTQNSGSDLSTTKKAMSAMVSNNDSIGQNSSDPSSTFQLPQSLGRQPKQNSNIGLLKENLSDQLPKGLPAWYQWYPNYHFDLPNGFLRKPQSSQTPGPKTISSFHRHAGIQVRNDPTTPQSCMGNQNGNGSSQQNQQQYRFGGGFGVKGQTTKVNGRNYQSPEMTFGGVSSAVKKVSGKQNSMLNRGIYGSCAKQQMAMQKRYSHAPTPKIVPNQQSLLDVESDFDAASFM